MIKFLFALLLIPVTSFAGDSLRTSMKVSSQGMSGQSQRMKIIAENIANKDSIITPNGNAYRRKIVIMEVAKNKDLNTDIPKVKKIDTDKSSYKRIYDPKHPLADSEGYVNYPNVDSNIENIDSKDAMRGYEANLSMLDISRNMYMKSLDLLK